MNLAKYWNANHPFIKRIFWVLIAINTALLAYGLITSSAEISIALALELYCMVILLPMIGMMLGFGFLRYVYIVKKQEDRENEE